MRFSGSFGNWLKQRRKALDLTQQDLADQVGCSIESIRKIERDTRRPSRQIVELLADALMVAPDDKAAFVAFARRVKNDQPPEVIPAGASAVNLPEQSTPFIGRERELADISTRLADPTCRLLTLVGPGGIGKTSLALQAAAQAVNFAHGVHFVPLAPVRSSDLLASTIVDALQLTFLGQEDLATQLIIYLRGKSMLLVIDNFEHLLDGLGLLLDVLANAAGLKLLVTSRERLNVREEWVFPLNGLPFPTAITTDQPESYSAIQLFMQQARRIQPTFTFADNAAPVIDICRAIEGMPLAIELSVSWLRVMTCQHIAERLTGDLNFLTTPLRDVPERHHSMRAVFERSWELLSSVQQAVLSRLSVFRGGFDLQAAEQVAEASPPLLAGLADKSLIRLNLSGRYDLHELLRQFAADKLSTAGQESVTMRRHLEYFSWLADQMEAHLYGPAQEGWLDHLEIERDNINAALAAAVRNDDAESAYHLAGTLEFFWVLRTHPHEGYEWCEKVIAMGDGGDAAIRSKVLVTAAVFANFLGDAKRAKELCDEGLILARQAGDKQRIAWALNVWGFYVEMIHGGDIAALEESLTIFREIGDSWGISHTLRRLGWALGARGEYEKAKELLEEALMLARKAKDKNAAAWSLLFLATIFWNQGMDVDRTIAIIREVLPLGREIREKAHLTETLLMLGEMARAQGDYEQAQLAYDEALALYRETGQYFVRIYVAQALAGFGALILEQGKPDLAATAFGASSGYLEGLGGHYLFRLSRAKLARDIEATRVQLGEKAFAAAWAEGQTMTYEQAIAFTLRRPEGGL